MTLSRRRPYTYTEDYIIAKPIRETQKVRFFSNSKREVNITDIPIEIWFMIFDKLAREELPLLVCSLLSNYSKSYIERHNDAFIRKFLENDYSLKLQPTEENIELALFKLMDYSNTKTIDVMNTESNYKRFLIQLCIFYEICEMTAKSQLLDVAFPKEIMERNQLIALIKTLSTIKWLEFEKKKSIDETILEIIQDLRESLEQKINLSLFANLFCLFTPHPNAVRINELLQLCINRIVYAFDSLQSSLRTQCIYRV